MDRFKVFDKFNNGDYSDAKYFIAFSNHKYIFNAFNYGYNKLLGVIEIAKDSYSELEEIDARLFNFYRYSRRNNTIYFSIPSIINDVLIVSLNNTIVHIVNFITQGYRLDSVILDFTECDFANILDADNMFRGINVEISIKFPVGDNALKPVSVIRMFGGVHCSNINEVLRQIDFSSTRNTNRMFDGARVGDIDLTGITFNSLSCMMYMFNKCDSKHIKAGKGTFSKVTDTMCAFNLCENLEDFDISCFDSNSVTSARGMFMGCSRLQKITGNWLKVFGKRKFGGCDVHKIFLNCSALRYIDVKNIVEACCNVWDTYNTVNGYNTLFSDCISIEWAEKYDPIHINDASNNGICSAGVINSFKCDVLNIAGIMVGDKFSVLHSLMGRVVDKAKGIYNMPGLLIIDREQYKLEHNEYEMLLQLGRVKLSFIEHEDVESAIAKHKIFSRSASNDVSYVLVDKGA